MNCPCQSQLPYQQCCAPLHYGALAPDAQALMRSRFSAFVLRLEDYLLRTANPAERSPEALAGLRQTLAQTEWKGLRVLQHQAGTEESFVEFVAFFSEGGQLRQLHEKSRFVRREGQWLYWDGRFLPDVKVDRNGDCVCGSGRKFKKCCGG